MTEEYVRGGSIIEETSIAYTQVATIKELAQFVVATPPKLILSAYAYNTTSGLFVPLPVAMSATAFGLEHATLGFGLYYDNATTLLNVELTGTLGDNWTIVLNYLY